MAKSDSRDRRDAGAGRVSAAQQPTTDATHQPNTAADLPVAVRKMLLAKHKDRPNFHDYASVLFPDFLSFSGDRLFGDDGAIEGGLATFDGSPVTVIAQIKGKNTKENIAANFGMPHPEGYRKALRLMKQAEKFGRPVLCFVDTPGAFCGVAAEERGQGEAIARNLMEMMSLGVPVLTVVTGEGGSGGALALAVASRVYMLENAVYSVISPKGAASILWKDPEREFEAAERLRMTAEDLLGFGVIDAVVPEAPGGAHRNMQMTAKAIGKQIRQGMIELSGLTAEQLSAQRYQKYRAMGVFAIR